ncbi:deleted in malignant brain tumors 1 protein-like isoform X1 [Notolabrus celidotus]|uniref:deleted in malignant brain tumors 1 protein-like isoform X1 n=1 Tax=Notolabrus celidotus TaxID=1203425 RepID=UPI00148F5503|nr:deleted in malignant brain tumors 1 protein-like isoform X1 [Notolabrus celidotus]
MIQAHCVSHEEQTTEEHLLDLVCLLLTFSSPAEGGQIRLRGSGSNQCSGRVEILYGRTWGTVCDDNWDLNDAKVVCRQLNCGTALSAPGGAAFGAGSDPILLDDVSCSGSESSLNECGHGGFRTHDCTHSEDAGVVCSDVRLRLSGSGSTQCSGRVEILSDSNWGTVCDDNWDLNDAKVVCRQLNCGTALSAPGGAAFGAGSDPILLDDVSCSGSESSLNECGHRGFGKHDCGHTEDAGVVCSASLPKPSISMITVGQVSWGQGVSISCSITTNLLGGTFILKKTSGSFRMTQTPNSATATFNIMKVNFDHDGSYQCQYEKSIKSQTSSSPLSDPISLSVTVQLQQPSISLTSPNKGLVWSPEGAKVTRGYSLVFLCSINCSYPDGRFFLISSDASTVVIKPAVNHSASFEFPVVEYEHQGNYSCLYEVELSTQRFNSTATAPIGVVITLYLYCWCPQ